MMSTQLSQIAKKAKLDRTVAIHLVGGLVLTPEFLTETWGMMNRGLKYPKGHAKPERVHWGSPRSRIGCCSER
jgi:hypothetical protein